MSETTKLFFMVGESTIASMKNMGNSAGYKRLQISIKNQAIIFAADHSTRPPGLGIPLSVSVLSEKNIQPAVLPNQMSFSVVCRNDIPVKLSLTTMQSPGPSGCSRKPDYSPRLCPPSSALLCRLFTVCLSTKYPAMTDYQVLHTAVVRLFRRPIEIELRRSGRDLPV